MKNILIAAAALLLSACTTALPVPGEATALVTFSSETADLLVANKLNGQPVEDGRFFSVSPGHNELQVLVVRAAGEESTTGYFASIEFSEFLPAKTYQINLVKRGIRKSLQLIDDSGKIIGESNI